MNMTLDPQKLTAFTDVAWAWAITMLPRVAVALLILVIGGLVSRWISDLVRRIAGRSNRVDVTVQPVLAAIVRYGIMILVIVAALEQVGVQTASLLAVLGAAGLAIGLALQGTLTNIAAGIMLLWLRPFQVGDYIEVGGVSGTVREIGLFVCQLETLDGLFQFAPNSAIWNNPLKNYTRNPGRLIILTIKLPGTADAPRAQSLLAELAAGDSRILQIPAPATHIETFDGNLVLSFRLWARQGEVGAVQRSLIDAVRQKLTATGAEELAPIQILRAMPADNDPTRLLERA